MVIMNRTEKYAEKRKGIAKTEYILIERLNEISDTYCWSSQASGISIPDEIAEEVEKIWKNK